MGGNVDQRSIIIGNIFKREPVRMILLKQSVQICLVIESDI